MAIAANIAVLLMSGFVLQGYLIFVYVELNFIENKLWVHLIDQIINVHLIDKKVSTVHLQKVLNTMLNGCYLSTSL